MGVVVDTTGREYWQALLGAGGFTAVPRWTRDPTPGVAEHQEPIPEEVAAALYRLASSAALPLSSLLLAAHAKVLAALSGEVTVTTGFLVAGERPLPCRLSTEPATWRILLEHAREVEEQLMAHRNFPVGRLAGELGRPGPLFETVLDPAGDGGELAEHTALWLGVHRHPDRLELRLRYRSDVLDAEASARIAGYHRSALAPCAGRRPILGGLTPRRPRPGRRGSSRSSWQWPAGEQQRATPPH